VTTLQTPPAVAGSASSHEHRWELRSVDFTSTEQIRELQCEGCGEVLFT
jgi:hypothetical protein